MSFWTSFKPGANAFQASVQEALMLALVVDKALNYRQ